MNKNQAIDKIMELMKNYKVEPIDLMLASSKDNPDLTEAQKKIIEDLR